MAKSSPAREFGDVFLQELHAAAARRRRYRIDRVFEGLPEAPQPLPPWSAPADPAAVEVPPPAREELKGLGEKTDAARKELAEARALSAGSAEAKPRAEQVDAAAQKFLESAKRWHEAAEAHRDRCFAAALTSARQGASGEKTPEKQDWQRAEAIFTAAANALSAASREGRAECPVREGVAGQKAVGAEEISKAYGMVLTCEIEVGKALDGYCRADPRRRTGPAVRVCEWALRLAEAERHLFVLGTTCTLAVEGAPGAEAARAKQQAMRARSAEAMTATRQDVQRASHELNRARIAHAEAPPPPPEPVPPGPAADGPAPPPVREDEDPGHPLARARKQALEQDLVGLALSGGGIRSATFALGVLQGLAQLRLLGTVDYLSTVSGGGYIGSWFAAWVQREGSLTNVERQLSPNRISQAQADRLGLARGQPVDPEPEPVHHLRAYSRYLSPRHGPFSPDSWTLLTIISRNLFVNSLFIVPLAVALVFLWRLGVRGFDAPAGRDAGEELLGPIARGEWGTVGGWLGTLRFWATLGFLVAFGVGSGCLIWEQENLFETTLAPRFRRRRAESLKTIHFGILFCLLLTTVFAAWIFSVDPEPAEPGGLRYFGERWLVATLPWSNFARFAFCFFLFATVLSVAIRLWRWVARNRRGGMSPFNARGVASNLLMAALFGSALYATLELLVWPCSSVVASGAEPELRCLLYTVTTPLLLAGMVLAGFTEMAFTGRLMDEYQREWRSRLAAYLLMGATTWLLLGGTVLYLPYWTERFFAWLSGSASSGGLSAVLKAVLAALWAGISGGGAWAASRGAAAPHDAERAWWVRPLAGVAPVVFLLGLLGGVSSFGQSILDRFAGWTDVCDPNFLLRATHLSGWHYGALIATAGAAALVFGWLLSVNRFSLHMLYANRLTRCYLGASRRKSDRLGGPPAGSGGAPTGVPLSEVRQTNLFTGFDPHDDLALAELRTVGADPTPYAGPLPIINTALNCLAGDELAHQDRRADAFALTPADCGGRLTGYAPTPREGPYDQNLTLGRAMTISGAAVDPNMSGVSPPLTALMTVCNTRLGWWLENPRRYRPGAPPAGRPWRAGVPGFGGPLLFELLGMTNENRAYVHLSDGGHFENLGVYELIRRRCRYLVVVDGGTDRTAASDNMAAMLMLVRTDFGVRIELDTTRMQIAGPDGRSGWHCSIGRVRYDEVDESAVPGLLVYLQATLTGDEPPDVLQYAARHPDFPRQSTLDQFFDEAQFECYRALGYHTATQVFGEAAARWTGRARNLRQHQAEVQAVFAHIREQWFPPPSCSETEVIAAEEVSFTLEHHIAENAKLVDYNFALYPEVGPAGSNGPVPAREVQEFRAVSQTLQVMELAWRARKLATFHAHPENRGWMGAFRRWTSTPAFHAYWPFLRAEYSKPFVAFCENVLNLLPPRVVLSRVGAVPPPLLAELDQSFGQDWDDQLDRIGLPAAFAGGRIVSDVVANARKCSSGHPFLWLISQAGEGASAAPPYSCGIVCAADTERRRILQPALPPADIAQEAEFFVWLRGPYRSMGVGTQAVAQILQEVEMECAFDAQNDPLRRLTVYYPLRDPGLGGLLELERWMNFFFDQGFRRIRQSDTEVGQKFAVLKRELNG